MSTKTDLKSSWERREGAYEVERGVGIVEVRMATELYQMSAKTVSKVILHATKYAHGEVCGCLLGRQEEHTVIVEDCIPFFHKAENKHSPLLEVALAQVRSIDIMRSIERLSSDSAPTCSDVPAD